MISRYKPGKQYGTHVDDALMRVLRTDISFTLFLTEPETYEGGALVVESAAGEQEFKLAAGAMIVYPSTVLHRVELVQKGERLAAVGWARSFIRSSERAKLFLISKMRGEVYLICMGRQRPLTSSQSAVPTYCGCGPTIK